MAAQLGRIVVRVIDTSGNAVSGVSAEVRKQGATTSSTEASNNTTVDVHNPGGIAVNDTVVINAGGTDSATTRSVSTVAATIITVGGLGHIWANGDRLSPADNFPTIYSDSAGADSLSNPMTTDSSGEAFCWAEIAPYDIHLSGGGITQKLMIDVVPMGLDRATANTITTGSQAVYIRDTQQALASGDVHTSFRVNGSQVFKIDYQGGFTAAKASAITAGGLTLTADDLTFGATNSRIVPGATSLAFRNTANSASNIAITDAGAVTIRAGVTVTTGGATITAGGLTVTAGGATITAGNFTVTAGDIIMAATASQLVPGATSFAIRNTADDTDNLLVEDDGDVTIIKGLKVTKLIQHGAFIDATRNGTELTIGDSNNVKMVTSGGNVNTISGGVDGKIITIIKTAGSNENILDGTIKLAGGIAFQPAAATFDTITLIYDGTQWVEMSRSVNA